MTDRRSEILEATCRVIAHSGAHELRVEDVAKEVGVSPALVYYYFDTRGELLIRAFEHADARSTASTVEQIDLEAPARKRIEEILFHELDDAPAVRDNWIIWSELEASSVFDEELRPAVERRTRHWVKIVSDLVRGGHGDGSVPASVDPQEAAERLTGIVDSVGTKWMLGLMSQKRARQLVRGAIEREIGSPAGPR